MQNNPKQPPTHSHAGLQVTGLSKSYGLTRALENLDLAVMDGQILALLGPSGCGKTTLLRLVAGFERPDRGEIILGGRRVAGPGCFTPPERRGVGMVFQDYALFPHLRAWENIAFGLNGASRTQRQSAADEILRLVGLDGHGDRYPHELSGGERQRVALARALAPRPVLLLLDEPFSSLDAGLGRELREEVRAILKGIGATAVFVTHDQEEALSMGDCLAVLHQGRLEQVDSPESVFHQPATRFVAEFIGGTDFLPGTAGLTGIQTELGLLSQPVDLPPGTAVELAVRPDDVTLAPPSGEEGGAPAVVVSRHFQGALNLYRVRLPSGQILHSYQPHTHLHPPGAPVRVLPVLDHPLACFYRGRAVRSDLPGATLFMGR